MQASKLRFKSSGTWRTEGPLVHEAVYNSFSYFHTQEQFMFIFDVLLESCTTAIPASRLHQLKTRDPRNQTTGSGDQLYENTPMGN